MTDNATIAAIATPIGSGGIGVIKLSGPKAFEFLAAAFRKSGHLKTRPEPDDMESHRFYHGLIVDPETGILIDEVLAVWMQSPKSYTREDVTEIHTHGGTSVTRAVLQLMIRLGARPAQPGEFTQRAFLNGRIDLTQAEAVMEVIHAANEKALLLAVRQIQGGLRKTMTDMYDSLHHILAHLEAAIDFPDEVDFHKEHLLDLLHDRVIEPAESLERRYEQTRPFRDGVRVAIAGKPNVGKSSILNRLLERDRAIVTSHPGTTRDLIEETIRIHQMPVCLIDSAGLHDSCDPIEKIGIEKAYECIREADLILYVTEAHRPISIEDTRFLDSYPSKPILWVRNKDDLLSNQEKSGRETLLEVPAEAIFISAFTGKGIDILKKRIYEICVPIFNDWESPALLNFRQKDAIHRGLSASATVRQNLMNDAPMEMISLDIREAIQAFGEVIGHSVEEDVLDRIFKQFCIGK